MSDRRQATARGPSRTGRGKLSSAIRRYSVERLKPVTRRTAWIRRKSTATLAGGQSLYSPNLQFRLTMQLDSNLVLYNAAGGVLYASDTKDQGIYQAIMQSDGNFCMYETQGLGVPVCSGTAGRPGAHLTVQDSGHAQVIDASGAVAWSVP